MDEYPYLKQIKLIVLETLGSWWSIWYGQLSCLSYNIKDNVPRLPLPDVNGMDTSDFIIDVLRGLYRNLLTNMSKELLLEWTHILQAALSIEQIKHKILVSCVLSKVEENGLISEDVYIEEAFGFQYDTITFVDVW